jgi:hypothetical protein
MATIIIYIFIAYISIFSLLVIFGKQKDWADAYGFLYSKNEWLDTFCSILFYPIYLICNYTIGIQKLSIPFKRLE